FIPGFALTGLYLAYVVGVTLIKPQWAPALPPEAEPVPGMPNSDEGVPDGCCAGAPGAVAAAGAESAAAPRASSRLGSAGAR
ncbi:MAG: hypothetical protein B7X41_13460, partial [Microbacterium sp. 14-71-5]